MTYFKRIKNISPFQFFLIGGNFINFPDNFQNTTKPELSIHLYKEYETKLNPIDIFMTIRQAIKYFEGKFHSEFPFDKIDVIFVKDYQEVVNSSSGVIIIDQKFLEETVDKIDINYLHFMIVTQM
jgi:hypothetical protein